MRHAHLAADDEMDSHLFRLHVGAHHAVDAVPVREGKGGEAELPGLLHEFLRTARPLQKGVIALDP